MSKPSIIFVPGSFALPEFYDTVVDPIAAKGYDIRALHNLSSGLKTGPREGTPPTMYDDAAQIAAEAEKLADEGKDVILVAHSYGGTPMTESTKGLSKKERQAQGKKGGIVKLAYMTCLVPAVGVSAGGVLGGSSEDSKLGLKIDEKGWMYHEDIPGAARVVFSDLPASEGEAWMRRFPRHTAVSFGNELTHAGYKDIPSAWLFCEKDLCIPATTQREAIALIEKVSGQKVDVTSIETDHCPQARRPELVIDWILDVAESV
ncbi:alpha/beta-hydrolase [Melanomma pulvis-pyrius CBS 109.77]|uniref:Alpha/beta-hydrolase n=1 Tax=Melanomma pulvis-pyrius CBS 109.77 TaxID=1314802 RepID=A0A6A6XLA9_9PLEO|nr:alpha/beta-hydrolase [Melanomma pulvis-pyrius CBS 109.77]